MFRKPKSPETIATEFGWANPKTGELLVSIRGLPNPVSDFVMGRPYNPKSVTVIEEDVKSAEKVETPTEEPVRRVVRKRK